MTSLLDDLLDLFLPASCVACGEWGAMLCSGCSAAVAGPAFLVAPPPSGVPPCWAGGRYDGALRAAIVAYKERRRHSLAGPLGSLLAMAVAASVPGAPMSGAESPPNDRTSAPPPSGRIAAPPSRGRTAARSPEGRTPAKPPGEPSRDAPAPNVLAGAPRAGLIWLVPVPSSAQAVRARGGDHLRTLALIAARELRGIGRPARVSPLLVTHGQRLDSVGLDAVARRENVAGGLRLSRRFDSAPRFGSGDTLVLVDDLVTTGATLAEAARTLAAGGWPVRRAAVLAAPARHAVAARSP